MLRNSFAFDFGAGPVGSRLFVLLWERTRGSRVGWVLVGRDGMKGEGEYRIRLGPGYERLVT